MFRGPKVGTKGNEQLAGPLQGPELCGRAAPSRRPCEQAWETATDFSSAQDLHQNVSWPLQ